MAKIDPAFAKELQKYGTADFQACYSCGNCTAICNLTDKNANFPRMYIRYGMLGLKEEILDSKDLWMCYACGDCTATCPRQAIPGDYMATMRRYAIAHYDPTGLTRLIFKNNPWYIAIIILLAVILGFFLLTLKPEMLVSRWIFQYMPFEIIHNIGEMIFTLTGLLMLVGFWNMVRHLSYHNGDKPKKRPKAAWLKSLKYVVNELVTMKRYRTCDREEDGFWHQKPNLIRPWFVHWTIMWGFLGLLLATVLDFLLKDPSTTVWWPSRILGTVSGLFMLYGAGLALYYRMVKITDAYANSKLADWVFLWSLWIAGLTGFWMEIAVMLGGNTPVNQVVLVIHVIIAMELVLLFAFSKFAHALYRPVALYMYHQNIAA